VNSGEEISREFIVACGDGSELLEFIEEAFDKIALAIEREGAGALCEAVCLGGITGVIPRSVNASTNASESNALSPIKATGSTLSISASAQARS
jgi:hypothetical protein